MIKQFDYIQYLFEFVFEFDLFDDKKEAYINMQLNNLILLKKLHQLTTMIKFHLYS